jgi:hypothetical protein
MDVLSRHIHFIEKGPTNHEDIAVGMIMRNITLVRPKEVDVLPGCLVLKFGGEELIEESRRTTSRESDAETAAG